MPENLVVESLASGDKVLRLPNKNEAEFDVIGMVVGICLETPPGYARFVCKVLGD